MTLDGAALVENLADTCWHTVEVVESTGSTNADLIARAASEEIGGTVRVTTDQTTGRGRHARVWSAPAGGQLAMSSAVAVGGDTEHLGWLSLIAGLAVARAVEAVAGRRPTLKWPNDVLVDDRKIAGILSEYTQTPTGGVAVIGVGLNTAMTEDQLPVPTATSLLIVTGDEVAPADIAEQFLRALSELLALWPADVDRLADMYRDRSDTLGRRVRLVLPGDNELVGTAVRIDRTGRIVIDVDGREVVAAAGDVTHLRPID
ncbi:biotin--[acetyl-CoA-carboxylase] ligase [Gordonia sp. SID5947]|uniref:biotin--[acetyl-CoA-carboxylase] ligase n=1 Tax=Gordonia sp. SID5947 TaxID=2690315 RepID=UPI00136BFBCD|nr:biotin--[acetyl-CoA-carboxylase] ligase [Gordonia sp. SID5947]MYR06154.1 biotin--[acetyl-CoA-carboxylase] ligase [Gordonia sp. SID5947]